MHANEEANIQEYNRKNKDKRIKISEKSTRSLVSILVKPKPLLHIIVDSQQCVPVHENSHRTRKPYSHIYFHIFQTTETKSPLDLFFFLCACIIVLPGVAMNSTMISGLLIVIIV